MALPDALTSSSQWNVAPPDLYGCRLWLGKVDKDGYPVRWAGKGRPSRVHRDVYEERHGKIPEGKEVEHRCRRRACLTDAHHTLVTRVENERRKRWRSRVKADLCDARHDAVNAQITPEGGRVCRICSRTKGSS